MRPTPVLVILLALAVLADGARADDGLTEDQRVRLERDKVLVAGPGYASVSAVYKRPDLPLFITSDSVLAAYHSLLREATARMEWARGKKLRAALAAMEAALPEAARRFDLDETTFTTAQFRAGVLLATARSLLGDEPAGPPAVLRAAGAEVDRIEAATGVLTPEPWYGRPSPGFARIDYTSFRATGLLARVPETARVARVSRWLAFVPFRLERDAELAAFLLLAAAAEGVPAVFASRPGILPPAEDPCLATVPRLPARVDDAALERIRKAILAKARPPEIRDLPTLPGHPGAITARILPLAATPDAVLLQRISDRQVATGVAGMPSALAIAAALGSDIATRALLPGDRAIAAAVREAGFSTGDTLHARYLRCLERLLAATPEAAPDLFRGEPWRTKSLQTVMAGFTFRRQAWDLRIKNGSRVLGSRKLPAGFVEPIPAFYRDLAGIVTRTRELVGTADGPGPSYEAIVAAATWEAAARALERTAPQGSGSWREYRHRMQRELRREPLLAPLGYGVVYMFVQLPMRELFGERNAGPRDEREREKVVRWIRDRAATVRGRTRPASTRFSKRLADLAGILDTLSCLAEKQLAGQPFLEEDDAWIRKYGQNLGYAMGEGDGPTDDAPTAVAIFSDPANGRHLVEAVGRPRAVYLLYPAGETEILCRGAVNTWYEMSLPRPPTDAEWRARLDSDDPPEVPEAVRGICAR